MHDNRPELEKLVNQDDWISDQFFQDPSLDETKEQQIIAIETPSLKEKGLKREIPEQSNIEMEDQHYKKRAKVGEKSQRFSQTITFTTTWL